MTKEKQEYPSTYFVEDRSNEAELARLRIQDQMITRSMGGVLPEQPDPQSFQRILDVACGTGSWLIETAQTYPDISLLIGVDVSAHILGAARSQAEQQGLADRVEFHVMDALRMLEFPQEYFDLINLRLGSSFLRTWDWRNLLAKFQHVSQPGGTIRITDTERIRNSTSPALNTLWDQFQSGLYRSGHLFDPTPSGISGHLEELLHQSGLLEIQKQSYLLHYRTGTPETLAFIEDMQYTFRTLKPFISKWGCASSDYDELYQQALIEMQQPDFTVTWPFLTVWGQNK